MNRMDRVDLLEDLDYVDLNHIRNCILGIALYRYPEYQIRH